MEKTRKVKHYSHKHGKPCHRPLDAYELYELEHKPHTPVKLPSLTPKPIPVEPAVKRDQFWNDSTYGNDANYEKNIDAQADKFIAAEHHKFKVSKWMSSMSAYEGDSDRFTDISVTSNFDGVMYDPSNYWSSFLSIDPT